MNVIFVRRLAAALLVCALFAAVFGAQVPTQSSDSSVAVVIVTVLTKKSAVPAEVVQKEDIILSEDGVRKQVMAWIPARNDHASLKLAIVVDEACRNDMGNQLQSLKKFILAQPLSTALGIYYALGDSLRPAIQLSVDHDAVANALRPPLGSFGNFVSPYSAVSQLIGKWPVGMARREILLLTPGFDLIHHELHSPDMMGAIDQAQRAGILVHPILVNAAGRLSPYSEIGRTNLTQLGDETGGASLVGALTPPLRMREETGGASFRDTIPVLDFSPVLKSLNTALENQYFLVWKTARSKSKNGELRSVAVRAEESNLRIIAPAKVYVP